MIVEFCCCGGFEPLVGWWLTRVQQQSSCSAVACAVGLLADIVIVYTREQARKSDKPKASQQLVFVNPCWPCFCYHQPPRYRALIQKLTCVWDGRHWVARHGTVSLNVVILGQLDIEFPLNTQGKCLFTRCVSKCVFLRALRRQTFCVVFFHLFLHNHRYSLLPL